MRKRSAGKHKMQAMGEPLSTLSELPDDLFINHVLSKMDVQDLCSLASVSRRLRKLTVRAARLSYLRPVRKQQTHQLSRIHTHDGAINAGT